MRCPACKRETTFEGSLFRPFCSERCKMIDLDNWLSGRYRISTPLHRLEETSDPDAAAGTEFGDSNGDG